MIAMFRFNIGHDDHMTLLPGHDFKAQVLVEQR